MARRWPRPPKPDPGVLAFHQLYGRLPEGAWAAPGRVNIMGDHTDYNDGCVLPMALPQRVLAFGARRDDGKIRLHSLQSTEAEPLEVPLDELAPGKVGGWAAYPAGTVWALREAGHDIRGLDLVFNGDVPQGAGLGSSAALECATALAATDLYEVDVERPTLARITQRAENDFVGVPCGIMDQYASLLCKEKHVLFLDTRTMEHEHVLYDLEEAYLWLLIVDTGARHEHVEGEYAKRQQECREAREILGVSSLRDVPVAEVEGRWPRLWDQFGAERYYLFRRVRHVVTENERVFQAVKVLKESEPHRAPRLLRYIFSHSQGSLLVDYEVVEEKCNTAAFLLNNAIRMGCRQTGGGFGGCVIIHVEHDLIGMPEWTEPLEREYALRGWDPPVYYTVRASDGAKRLDLDLGYFEEDEESQAQIR